MKLGNKYNGRSLGMSSRLKNSRCDQNMLYTCMKFSKNTFVKTLKY